MSKPLSTNPPFFEAHIQTTGDALLVFEAVRQRIIPRVTRRVLDKSVIRSGAVFVFSESESNIKRWTDSHIWSPSRIMGNFLLYRETNKRYIRGSVDSEKGEAFHSQGRRKRCLTGNDNGHSSYRGTDPIETTTMLRHDPQKKLIGPLSDERKFKRGGLCKKTISVIMFIPETGKEERHQLVSYYSVEDAASGRLHRPGDHPGLRGLVIGPDLLRKEAFRTPPTVMKVDGISQYLYTKGEVDECKTHAPERESSLLGFHHKYPPSIIAPPSSFEQKRPPPSLPSIVPPTSIAEANQLHTRGGAPPISQASLSWGDGYFKIEGHPELRLMKSPNVLTPLNISLLPPVNPDPSVVQSSYHSLPRIPHQHNCYIHQSYTTEVGDANASALEVIPHRRPVPARLNFLVTPSYGNSQSPCGSCYIPSTASTVPFPFVESPIVTNIVTEDGESMVGDMGMEMMYYPIPYKCHAVKESEHHVFFPCGQ